MFYGNPCNPCGPCADKVAAPIMHPAMNNMVNTYSSTIVPHVHPQHTTVVNHHVTKHAHMYPQSTSFANTSSNVDLGSVSGIAPMGGFGGVQPMPLPAPIYGQMMNTGMMGGNAMPTGTFSGTGTISGTYSTGSAQPLVSGSGTGFQTQYAPTPGVKETPLFPGM